MWLRLGRDCFDLALLIRELYANLLLAGEDLNAAPFSFFRIAGEADACSVYRGADLHSGPSILINESEQNCLFMSLAVLAYRGRKNGDLGAIFSVFIHDQKLPATKDARNVALRLFAWGGGVNAAGEGDCHGEVCKGLNGASFHMWL